MDAGLRSNRKGTAHISTVPFLIHYRCLAQDEFLSIVDMSVPVEDRDKVHTRLRLAAHVDAHKTTIDRAAVNDLAQHIADADAVTFEIGAGFG
jgi:hypothetical protein